MVASCASPEPTAMKQADKLETKELTADNEAIEADATSSDADGPSSSG